MNLQEHSFIPVLYKIGGIFYSWLHILGDAKVASGFMIMMSVGYESATKTTILGIMSVTDWPNCYTFLLSY